jgi:uncharacterized protein (DUF1697 family)
MQWIALLRAVNVGTGRKVAMADLRTWMEEAGAGDVVTYIQSGNVVFSHASRSEPELAAQLEARITKRAGFAVPVMLRTAAQLAAVVDANPFPKVDPDRVHVGFMAERPARAAFSGVDAAKFEPEQFAVIGRELWLHLPHGVGRARLPVALGKVKAAPPATLRNWRTVAKLVELSSS